MGSVFFVDCTECKKRFYVTEDLKLQVQEGQRDYLVCPWCKKRFKPNLK